MPYPYDKHKHQNDNAAALVTAGAAVVIDDRLDGQANAAALKDPLQMLLGDEMKRAAMADAVPPDRQARRRRTRRRGAAGDGGAVQAEDGGQADGPGSAVSDS